MSRGIWAAGVVAAAALIGCGTGDPDRPRAERPTAEPAIEVSEVRSAAIERAVQEQRGKVVFIDFWATT
jgi:hypothetical protein